MPKACSLRRDTMPMPSESDLASLESCPASDFTHISDSIGRFTLMHPQSINLSSSARLIALPSEANRIGYFLSHAQAPTLLSSPGISREASSRQSIVGTRSVEASSVKVLKSDSDRLSTIALTSVCRASLPSNTPPASPVSPASKSLRNSFGSRR